MPGRSAYGTVMDFLRRLGIRRSACGLATAVALGLSAFAPFIQPNGAGAMPAAPDLHQVRQNNGATFPARRWGNADVSGWETEDGATIIFDAGLGGWAYADLDKKGSLVSSGRLVGIEPPPLPERKRVRPLRHKKLKRGLKGSSRAPAAPAVDGSTTASPLAVQSAAPEGKTGLLPVILVNFSDTTPLYTPQDFTTLLFGSGAWSMQDYYREVSYGAFTVSPGSAGIAGWVGASHPHDYYGSNRTGTGDDAWPADLVREAVEAADATVDFSQYDGDGDCFVDVVAVVHQGTGEEASAVDADIWSHSWSLGDAFAWGYAHSGIYTTNDRCLSDSTQYVKIDNYIIQPEQYAGGLTTVGVFAHEYGHALGLPDLYDTDGSSEGVGEWSLMAGGGWTGISRGGDRPSHLDPWSKYRLGWIAPTLFTTSVSGKTFAGIETTNDYYQFRSGTPGATGEYFLMENRQKESFDAALPGSGLLLWHIDESIDSNDNEWYPGCTNCASHYQVALVQADNLYSLEKGINRGSSGDPFPGTSYKYAIDGATSPGNNLYSGGGSGFAINGISASAATMTANIVITDTTPPVTTIGARPPAVSSSPLATFTFTGNEPATFECQLDGGSFAPCTSPKSLLGLANGDHTFTVRATDAVGNRESAPPAVTWNVDPTITRNAKLTLSGQPIYYFSTLTEAVTAVPAGAAATLLARGMDFTENITVGIEAEIAFGGGYNATFDAVSTATVVRGSLTLAAGTVSVDRLVLQ